MKTLTIGVPAYGGAVQALFVASLVSFVTQRASRGEGTALEFVSGESLIPRARNELAARFLASDSEALLMVDGDIGFSPDDMHAIVGSGFPLVGLACPIKVPPTMAPRFALHPLADVVERNGERVAKLKPMTSRNGRRYVECAHLGTGAMFVRRNVFAAIAKRNPERVYHLDDGAPRFDFFPTLIAPRADDATKKEYLSEDYGLCALARVAGFAVHALVDANVQHVGSLTWSGNFGVAIEDANARNNA